MAPGGGMAPNWGNRVNSTSPSTILEDYHELVGTVAKVITSTLSTQEGFGSTGYDSGTNLPSGTNLQTGTGFDAGTDFGTGAKNGLNIPTFGFTTPGYGTDNFGTIDTQAFDLSTPGFEFTTPGPPVVERTAAMFVYALFLVLIPTATILGNVLVILSVLRFKALHSAINFLILGLAVADLFVAVFVMPYAVYVYIQGGNWFLGNLMCDIYSACDVACSTASIFLLAVISFDRYRAVSKPIQYSRQSQNIRRVVLILVMIWVASLALASPIVLGLNHRPEDASPYECRFYNAEFTLVSSIVSFVIPCFIVLFVYIRIMMALRKREKAAKLRRLANQQQDHKRDGSLDEVDAGQIVAAPAVNVLMLALPSMQQRMRRFERHRNALQQADDHDANSSSPISSSDSLSDNLHVVTNDFVSEAPTSMSRKSSEYDSQQTNGTNNPTQTYHSRNRRLSRESSLLRNPMKRFKSLHVSPRNIALPNMDIARPGDIWRHFSRRSPRIFGPPTIPSPKLQKKYSYAEEAVFTTTTPLLDANRRKSDSSAFATTPPNELQLKDGIDTWPVDSDMQQERNDIQQLITEINTHSNQKLNLMGNEMRMKSFENDKINAKDGRNMAQNEVKMAQNEMKMAQNEMKMNILENERKISMIDNEMSPKSPSRRFEGALTSAVLGEEMDYVDVDSMHGSQTAKQTIIIYSEENTSSVTDLRDEKSPKPTEEEALNLQTSLNIMTVSSDDHSVTNEATIATDSGFGPDSKEHNEIVITNLCAKETSDTPRKISKGRRCDDAGSPTVTFKIPGKKHDKHRPDRPIKRLSSAAQIYENKRAVDKNGVTDPNDPKHKRSFSQRLRGSLGAVVGPTNSRSEHSMDSCYSSGQSQGTNTTVGAGNSSGSKDSKKGRILSNSKINGSTTELAVRMVKKAINRKESSLKRKVNKAQRKEKRATKTLGIVVGIFLVCWVPFFFINILTGICTKLDIEACQIGFGPFFYATWIGYMNSFMNPVIYTIFNTEFRRAFKSLLLGKSTNRRNRGHPV